MLHVAVCLSPYKLSWFSGSLLLAIEFERRFGIPAAPSSLRDDLFVDRICRRDRLREGSEFVDCSDALEIMLDSRDKSEV